MLLLALDSSAKAASCAVFDTEGQRIIAYGGVNAAITHSETLLPLVERTLAAAKLELRSIGSFAVTSGPGSFTGVRIAVSAVKGMAFALGKPVYAVSALESLAYNLLGQNCSACCVMDARRGEVYNALFRVEGERVTRLCADRAIAVAELERELTAYKNVVIIGDGAELITNFKLAPVTVRQQNAVSVCIAALNTQPISAKELVPMYLRLSQAERERKEEL